MAKSMNGIVTLSDGAGTIIENGNIISGGINATSISSDEYNTRGKSKMDSTTTVATSSTPYTISYGTAQNIVFTGSVVQTVILPVVLTENLGATFTIIRTAAVQMIIQAPSGYTFYDENNSFSNGVTLFSNTRVVTFTAINTTASPAMWSMTYSQSPNQNLAVTISNTQNITGTKSFNQANFNLLPSFIGTLGAVANTNFITKGIADASYQPIGNYVTLGGTNAFTGTNTFNTNLPTSTLTPTTSTELITKAYGDGTYPRLSVANTFTNINTFNNGVYINNTFLVDTTSSATFYNTTNPAIGVFTVNLTANTLTCTLLNSSFTKTVGIQTGNIDALTVTNTAIFSGAIPTYTGSSTAYADNTFFPRSYGDTRYAQLTANNTFSGTTTFTGSIIANGLTITPTELGYLDGVNNGIQGQLNNRVTLTTNQTNITGEKTFNANLTMGTAGYLQPLFPLSSTSMRIGANSMQYSNAGSVNNIAIGINAMQGTTNVAYDNSAVRCVVIGTEAYQNTTYGTANSTHADNVIIGHQAMKQHYYNNYENVCIGSQNCKGGTGSYKSVMIGSKISVNSGQHSYSVIIGADNFPSTAINNGTVVGYGNFAFSTLGYANGLIIFGDNNMTNCVDFNRSICVGSNSLLALNSQFSTICVGTDSIQTLSTGGYVSAFGSFITTTNNSLSNTTIIGTGSTTGLNNVCYIGGNDRSGTPVYQDLLPAGKNKILCQNDFTSVGTANLTFEMGEHINLDTSTSNVNLPQVFARNIGARFIIYRDFTANVCTITSSNAFGLINNTGAAATTYNIPAGACYVTLVAIAVQPTSGVPIVCWIVLNQDLNNEVSTISYNTTAIGYDGTSTSISSPLILNNGAIDFQDVKAITGTVGTLAVPLSSVYTITGTTTLTLPAITADITGVRLTFIKQDTNSLTISRSSTDTFRYQGSATSTSAGPLTMQGNWTIVELVAQTGVWNIVNTNDKFQAVNTTLNTTNFTIAFPFFQVYQIGLNTAANITVTIPAASLALVGETFTIRRTSSTAPTFSVISSVAYYPIGSVTTTTTLLNTTTFKITLQCLYLTASTYAWYAV